MKLRLVDPQKQGSPNAAPQKAPGVSRSLTGDWRSLFYVLEVILMNPQSCQMAYLEPEN